MEEQPSEKKETAEKFFRRPDDFTSLYANNIQFEASVWDLKVLFGQLDQSETPNFVEQHTAITLSWLHAKLSAYYFAINVLIHQATNGNIQVPASVLPPRPDPNDPGLDEAGKRAVRYLAWVHDQFFGPSPYIPPDVNAEE